MKIHREFSLVKQGWNSVYPYAPKVEECESEQFPADQILAGMNVRDEHLVSFETIISGKPQEFNRILADFKRLAFSGLGKCDENRGALSLEQEISPKKIYAQDDELQIRASNDQVYFMANIQLIRRALEDMKSIQANDREDLAQGLQKALVSYGLKKNYPVMFALCMVDEADKPVMYQADRYLWKNRRAKEAEADQTHQQVLAAE